MSAQLQTGADHEAGATGAAPITDEEMIQSHRASKRKRRIVKRAVQLLMFAAVVASYYAVSTWVIDPFWISSPLRVAGRFWEWTVSGFIVPHMLATLQAMSYGLVIGTVLGLVVGLALGTRGRLAEIMDPFIITLFAIPKLALTPLLILLFGIGLMSKVVLVIIIVFFFVFFNTYAGVRDVNEDIIAQTRIMGASEWVLVWSVLLPSAASWIFTGLRLALRQALTGAVVGEMLAANAGLGYLMAYSAGTFDSTGVYTALVFITVIAVVLNGLAGLGEARLTRWKSSTV